MCQINDLNFAISYLTKISEKNISSTSFEEVINHLKPIIFNWVHKNNVGIQKDKRLKSKYDVFFSLLLNILKKRKSNEENSEFREFANAVLYQGTVFRVLGHPRIPKDEKIEVIYDNVYTHWSTIKGVNTIMEKLKRTYTYLEGYIGNDDYGIYLSPFKCMLIDESEVVFPTKSDSVISISYEEITTEEKQLLKNDEEAIKELENTKRSSKFLNMIKNRK